MLVTCYLDKQSQKPYDKLETNKQNPLRRSGSAIKVFFFFKVIFSTLNLGFYAFTYRELTHIAGNWDERPASVGGSRLGEGGFGIVFKGLHNNKPVAVKKLNLVSI